MFKILEKKMLNPTICKMVVEAPRIAKAALPGQFLIVRADEPGERIPLTISDYDREKGTVTIVIQPIGASTRSMVNDFEAGDSFADVAGPLGNPSEFVKMSPDELAKQKFEHDKALLETEAEGCLHRRRPRHRTCVSPGQVAA